MKKRQRKKNISKLFKKVRAKWSNRYIMSRRGGLVWNTSALGGMLTSETLSRTYRIYARKKTRFTPFAESLTKIVPNGSVLTILKPKEYEVKNLEYEGNVLDERGDDFVFI